MLKDYDIYLFDFDGTLFDTLESSIYVFEEAYRRIGVSIDRDKILGYTREPIPNSYRRVMGSMDGYPAFIKSIDELVFSDKVTQMAEIYSDTRSTIKELKKQGKVVGIVTSNAKSHIIDVLNRFDLTKYFDIIVGNREARVPKPSPEPILKALELLKYNGNKNRVIYVGDSLNDAIAAKNAGISPLLIDRLNEFKDSGYPVIDSLDEIIR